MQRKWSKAEWDDAIYEADVRSLMHSKDPVAYDARVKLLNLLSRLFGLGVKFGDWNSENYN